MAHFALIENGVVQQIVVVNNDVITVNGVESENAGQQFLSDLFGGTWVQCSYNGNPVDGEDRGKYPGIGWAWDGNTFIDPIAQER